MTRYRGEPRKAVRYKQPFNVGLGKTNAESELAVKRYDGPVMKCPPGRGSRRVRVKPLPPLPPLLGEDD